MDHGPTKGNFNYNTIFILIINIYINIINVSMIKRTDSKLVKKLLKMMISKV
jgi:hypothetical protein